MLRPPRGHWLHWPALACSQMASLLRTPAHLGLYQYTPHGHVARSKQGHHPGLRSQFWLCSEGQRVCVQQSATAVHSAPNCCARTAADESHARAVMLGHLCGPQLPWAPRGTTMVTCSSTWGVQHSSAVHSSAVPRCAHIAPQVHRHSGTAALRLATTPSHTRSPPTRLLPYMARPVPCAWAVHAGQPAAPSRMPCTTHGASMAGWVATCQHAQLMHIVDQGSSRLMQAKHDSSRCMSFERQSGASMSRQGCSPMTP
jgi:hypothetical protein